MCSKVKFLTNINHVTGIHTFYLYNNKHTYITTNTNFTTKHIHFIKTNIDPIMGPKCDPKQVHRLP